MIYRDWIHGLFTYLTLPRNSVTVPIKVDPVVLTTLFVGSTVISTSSSVRFLVEPGDLPPVRSLKLRTYYRDTTYTTALVVCGSAWLLPGRSRTTHFDYDSTFTAICSLRTTYTRLRYPAPDSMTTYVATHFWPLTFFTTAVIALPAMPV